VSVAHFPWPGPEDRRGAGGPCVLAAELGVSALDPATASWTMARPARAESYPRTHMVPGSLPKPLRLGSLREEPSHSQYLSLHLVSCSTPFPDGRAGARG